MHLAFLKRRSSILYMFGHNTFIPTLFKLLLPKVRYMGDEKCRIHLDAIWKIYIIAILNLQIARDKCLPPIIDLDKTDFKIGNMALIKNHIPKDAFDCNYKTSFIICKKTSDLIFKFDVQGSTGKVRWVSIQHLQFLYPKNMLTNLPDITSFRWTTKYIYHPNLIPILRAAIKEKDAHAWWN